MNVSVEVKGLRLLRAALESERKRIEETMLQAIEKAIIESGNRRSTRTPDYSLVPRARRVEQRSANNARRQFQR